MGEVYKEVGSQHTFEYVPNHVEFHLLSVSMGEAHEEEAGKCHPLKLGLSCQVESTCMGEAPVEEAAEE